MARCTQKRRQICVDLCRVAVDPADTVLYDRAQGDPSQRHLDSPQKACALRCVQSMKQKSEAAYVPACRAKDGSASGSASGSAGGAGTPIDSILESWQSGAAAAGEVAAADDDVWVKPDGASDGASPPIDAVLDAWGADTSPMLQDADEDREAAAAGGTDLWGAEEAKGTLWGDHSADDEASESAADAWGGGEGGAWPTFDDFLYDDTFAGDHCRDAPAAPLRASSDADTSGAAAGGDRWWGSEQWGELHYGGASRVEPPVLCVPRVRADRPLDADTFHRLYRSQGRPVVVPFASLADTGFDMTNRTVAELQALYPPPPTTTRIPALYIHAADVAAGRTYGRGGGLIAATNARATDDPEVCRYGEQAINGGASPWVPLVGRSAPAGSMGGMGAGGVGGEGGGGGAYEPPLDLGAALANMLDTNAKRRRARGGLPANLKTTAESLFPMGVQAPPLVTRPLPTGGRQARATQRVFGLPALSMSTKSHVTRLHQDPGDNFMQVVAGAKKVWLLPPSDAALLRPTCVSKAGFCNSNALPKPWKPKTAEEKAARAALDASLLTVEVGAGEMMYIPSGWYYAVQTLAPTVTVNWWTVGCEQVGMFAAHGAFIARHDTVSYRWDDAMPSKCPGEEGGEQGVWDAYWEAKVKGGKGMRRMG